MMSDTPQRVSANGGQITAPKVEYSLSGRMIARLAEMKAALAITSYQSGLLYMLGSDPSGRAQLHQSAIPKPMGLCEPEPGRLVMTGQAQIFEFQDILAEGQRINHVYDRCFMPRTAHLTGQLDAHDVGVMADGRIVFVNTRHNCLATVSRRDSFDVHWSPSFITDIVDEDRCHLNGMAMRDGAPAFVTAVSRSNTIDGWRDRRADGGVVIDVASGAMVCEGLSMPHSPRWHDGQLWVLNSGTGEIGRVHLPTGNRSMGRFEPVAFCPGFVRGLSIVGNLAFVGLSKPRYKRFEGLALDQKLRDNDSEAWCGVQVIDLASGTCLDWFRIDGDIGELYDVQVITGAVCPMTVSPGSVDAATLITFQNRAVSDAPEKNSKKIEKAGNQLAGASL